MFSSSGATVGTVVVAFNATAIFVLVVVAGALWFVARPRRVASPEAAWAQRAV
jgi:hypothetical protein